MDLTYCVQCGGSFIRDEATDTICGDCDETSEVVITESGIDWGFIVSELEWELANATDVDGMEALRETIDSQLPDAYWELQGSFSVTLTAEQAQMLDELRTKWAEQGI